MKKVEFGIINKNRFFTQGFIWRTLLCVACILLMFWVQYFYRRPNFGTFLASDMDSFGNVYVLGYEEKEKQYKITKVDSKGLVNFEKKLEKQGESSSYIYKALEVDSDGNFYVAREMRDETIPVSNPSLFPIVKENVLMFDTTGKEIKRDVVIFDFSNSSEPPTEGYIRRIDVLNQKMNIIGANNNVFDVTSVNPYEDSQPVKEFTFVVTPDVQLSDPTETWLNDAVVLSTGKVMYSDKGGNFMFLDPDGSSVNCRSLLPSSENSLIALSVDEKDNVYFTDILTGIFYSFDTSSMNLKQIYTLEDNLNNQKFKDYKIKDLRRIRSIGDQDFYASSKTFENPFYVRLGSVSNVVSNVRYRFFPWGAAVTFLGGLLLALLIMGLVSVFKRGLSRIPLALRITGLFLPVYLAIMAFLAYMNTSDACNDYGEVLRLHQQTGAKIVAENIPGDSLESVTNSLGKASPQYSELNLAVRSAYSDLKDKVGDRSDYIVVYALKGNKLYSVVDSKYSVTSNSYNELKFADPDMVVSEAALADALLERDEITSLYSAWDELKNKEKTVTIKEFRDVHGRLSACFAPVSSKDGRVVGFVGNFLDEKVHVFKEFNKIILRISTLVGLTTLVAFAYLCLVILYAFFPMRKLSKGINAMINGKWQTRVNVHSKDEIQDIAVAFNDMSGRLDTYTSNLMDLNEEYLRFVPKELLKLMGKEKITDVNVNDSKQTNLSIVYITFNIDNLETGALGGMMFESLGKSYTQIFDVVEKNNGVVQNFSGLGATVLFPGDASEAVGAFRQISNSSLDLRIKNNMRTLLGYGPALVGIIGNEIRRGVSLVSDEMHRLISIDNRLNLLGVSLVATEAFIKACPNTLRCRLLGKCTDPAGKGRILIYEIYESPERHLMELIEFTKDNFENGVTSYIDAKFEDARSMFADIIKVNEADKAAIYYLKKCDSMINAIQRNKNRIKSFDGRLF
ncbi:MAG: HAMP domain-containing protein [Oscillospiraceae bacterium]|jgi:hypothetical protein|nr:HAMP domain-containing protein [Oscillospiraceae bacterium]